MRNVLEELFYKTYLDYYNINKKNLSTMIIYTLEMNIKPQNDSAYETPRIISISF